MASARVQAQLNNLVSSMFAMNILGDYYKTLEDLDVGSNPSFLSMIITLFGNEFQELLTQVSKLLGNSVVDFQKVDLMLRQLSESSSHMGAERVILACKKFRTVCKENDREGCVAAMNDVRREFVELYKKLLTVIELKQQIEALDAQKIVGLCKL